MGHLNTGNIHYQDILESGIQLADLLECLSGFQMVLWRPSCTKPFESWTFKFSFQIVGGPTIEKSGWSSIWFMNVVLPDRYSDM